MEGIVTLIARCNIEGNLRVCRFVRERKDLDWTMSLFGNSASWNVSFQSDNSFKISRWDEDAIDTVGTILKVFPSEQF